MDRAMLEEHLAQAERRVSEDERHVACQRQIVADLERDGHDTGEATRLLRQFEQLLTMHISHRDWLRKELGS